MRSNRKRQSDIHTRGIAFNWRIEESFDFGECNDFIELPTNFDPRHSENRTIEIDVFSASQFRVKSSTDFEQARDPTFDGHTAFGWLGDAGKNFQKRALTGAVTPDNSNNLTTLDLKVHIFKCPELLDPVPGDHWLPTGHFQRL